MLFACTAAAALAEGDVVLLEDPEWDETIVEDVPEDEASDEEDTPDIDEAEALVIDGITLIEGDEGEDVRELQEKLKVFGYFSGKANGKYGATTVAAITAFQEEFGLEATGEADPTTQAVLLDAKYRPLRYGSEGEDVKALQTRLTELGYYKGKVSGSYLEGTKAAISAFQEKNGEDVTGEADVETQQVLFSEHALSKTATPPTLSPDELTVLEQPYTKRLARGSTGPLVKQVQQRLTDLGYYTGPVSGNFLGNTAKAVRTIQKQNGLKSDGIIGEATWNLIFNTEPDTLVMPEDTPKPTPAPTPVPYRVTVDVNNQVVRVFGLDENNEYTVPVRDMICSTGTKKNPSDVGDWTLNGKHTKWCFFPKWGSHARYWTRINASIAFHSIIYNAVDLKAANVGSYRALGHRASHGCVRLTVEDAKWVYENLGEGVVVSIREDLPDDPELRDSVKPPRWDSRTYGPEATPEPTAVPAYSGTDKPPFELTKLQANDSSEAVYWLQRKLTDLGYYTGKCSGTFLRGTVNAVKAFQKDHGLRQNGVADVATQEMIYADVLATPTPEPIATPAPTATPAP